jgi:hypothetical protein
MHTDTAIEVKRQSERTHTGVTLDSFARVSERAGGIRLRDLSACDCLHLRTRNSHYRLWVLNPLECRVLVQGGAFFCVPAEATIAGATAGGSMLKVGWILEGFNLEILHDGQRIVTTAVGSIECNPPDALPGPF